MELESYRNFLAIIEAGSFTGVAECVHVAQPALSKQLKTLENFFGAKLIITTLVAASLFNRSWPDLISKGQIYLLFGGSGKK